MTQLLTMSATSVKKLQGIELGRIISVFGVIVIHTVPFEQQFPAFAVFLNNFFRFAVPFFFIASGYFFAQSLDKKPLAQVWVKTMLKLARFFIIWSLIYVVWKVTREGWGPFWDYYGTRPVVIARTGTAFHLWFLPSLACGLSVVALFVKLRWQKVLLLVCGVMYAWATLSRAYSESPLVVPRLINDMRDGPFFSSLFVAMGYMIYRKQWKPANWYQGLGVFMVGVLWSLIEVWWLAIHWNEPLLGQDFVFGTVLLSIGSFWLFLALSDHAIGTWAPLGTLTLGVYLIHRAFLPYIPSAIGVFLISGAAVWLLQRFKITRYSIN